VERRSAAATVRAACAGGRRRGGGNSEAHVSVAEGRHVAASRVGADGGGYRALAREAVAQGRATSAERQLHARGRRRVVDDLRRQRIARVRLVDAQLQVDGVAPFASAAEAHLRRYDLALAVERQ